MTSIRTEPLYFVNAFPAVVVKYKGLGIITGSLMLYYGHTHKSSFIQHDKWLAEHQAGFSHAFYNLIIVVSNSGKDFLLVPSSP